MRNTKSFRIDSFVKLGFTALLAAQVVFAQMGGGMMGRGSSGSSMGGYGTGQQTGNMGPGGMSGQISGMGAGMGAGMGTGMGAGMGAGLMDGPAVGPDGTAYVVRGVNVPATSGQAAPVGQYQIRREIVAISPIDGTLMWKLAIPAGRVSEPAVAKDGKIFLTVDDTPLGMQGQIGGTLNPGTQTTPNKAKLLTIVASPASAQIQNTVEVASDVLSAPKIATDTAGNYIVYAYGMEIAGMGFRNADDGDSVPAGERDLYAFGSDGRLKFKVQLGQGLAGIPAR